MSSDVDSSGSGAIAAGKVGELLTAFARTLVTDYSVEDMLDRVCAEVVSVLAVTGAGVMLADEAGELRFVAASDDVVRQIEALQIELGEGPCLSAFQTAEVIAVPDLSADKQFSRFSPRAEAAGMSAVQSFPLATPAGCVGALNLYAAAPGTINAVDTEIGLLLADVCTTYVLNAQTLAASEKLASQLQRALDSRVVIEQAKGMVAEQFGVPVSEAFETLRRHARSNGRKLHDVASDVVNGSLRLTVAS